MSNENIFSALAKYNSAIDENYLTEAFVFVINSLLQKDRDIGLEILTKLCANNNEFSFEEDKSVSVSTQERTAEQGTPDIKVSSPDKLIYVEVKHDSSLGYKQIERYKEALESSQKLIKHVNLLTRFAVDFKDGEQPYKHIRWYEVYNWLAKARARVKDPICIYLIDSFNSFLEVKQMSLQKVSWEYINGVPAMINLVNMIEAAIEGARIPFYTAYPRAVALETRGFYLANGEFWCGIHYDNPLVITFEIIDKNKFNAELLDTPTYKLKEGKARMWFGLPLDKIHFFSLDKDEQLEEITKFLKTAHAEAQKMRLEEK